LSAIEERLVAAQNELTDLRAVRDALTPPELPARPGLSFAVSFAPATQRVSGDFYLAAEGPRDSTVLVVGDVAGKGAEAAQRAAFIRTAFVTTSRFSDDPSRLLEWANAALTERAGYTARFVTAVCMTFAPASRRLRWALAGHPPPLRLGTGDELSASKPGPPLGIREQLRCQGASIKLGTGDGVLLYTDGLVESRRDGELFGVDRARDIIREMAAAPTVELLSRLRDEAASFGGDTLADDLCLLAVSASRG
jgi:serine phosphatase RsbU (regulator of sigma subunit)